MHIAYPTMSHAPLRQSITTICNPGLLGWWDCGRIDVASVEPTDTAVIGRNRRAGVDRGWFSVRPTDRMEGSKAMATELHLTCRLHFTVPPAGPPTGPDDRATGESGSLSDRLPPQHLEAERGVLGSILLDNEVMHDIVVFLRAEDFYRDAHQVIYAAIRDLYDKNKGIDAVTLAEELKLRGQFEQVGGDDTLTEIVASVPHAANGKYYAEIVKQKATNRQLIESATEIIRDGYSNQFTAQELLESAERKIFGIAEDQIRGETLELKDVVKQAMDLIAVRADSGGHAVTGSRDGTDRSRRHHRRVPSRAIDHRGGPAQHGQDGPGAQYLRPRGDQPQGPRPLRQPGDGFSRDRRAPSVCALQGRRSQTQNRVGNGNARVDPAQQGL